MSAKLLQFDYTQPLVLPQKPTLIFADPPYNVGVNYEGDETNDNRAVEEYQQWLSSVMKTLATNMDTGTTLWWVCPEEDADWVGPALTRYVGPRLYRIVWHETFSQYNRYNLTRDYRFIFCHYLKGTNKKSITMNLDAIRIPSKRMILRDSRAVGPKIPGTVWQLRRLQGTAKDRVDWHPTQLPPELLDRIVLGWSSPTDLVLDAFAGSGSLGMRCLSHRRDFVGIDKSEAYCEHMRQRFSLSTQHVGDDENANPNLARRSNTVIVPR